MTTQETINNAVNFAVTIANDDSHGYDIERKNGDYDCSWLILKSWEAAGVPVIKAGGTYTGNMLKALLKCGFEKVNINTRRRGDVLLNEAHHVAMMVDDKNLVMASINELGTTTGGKPGDQTGREILVRPYYVHKYGWDYCLRYTGAGSNETVVKLSPVTVETVLVKNGVKSGAVKTLQILLNAKANERLTADGECGPLTVEAIKRYQSAQRAHGLTVDGECGKNTWNVILNN